jgi:hypothetical protein
MSNKNKIEPLFEVAIKINRQPLPPYWDVLLSNLTFLQAKNMAKKLNRCSEETFIFENH